MDETATRTSFGSLDFTGPFVAIPWTASIPAAAFEHVKRGVIPEQMEDKWFAFFEAPTLFVHRSWTGICIYQISFAAADTVWTVREALVLDDPGRYRRQAVEDEARLLERVFWNVLFRFPRGVESSARSEPRSDEEV